MRTLLALSLTILLLGSGIAVADDLEQYNAIREHLGKQQFDEAEKLFTASLAEYPDSARLKSLHYLFYVYLNRADRPLDAARHAEANLDVRLDEIANVPTGAARAFSTLVNSITSSYVRAEQPDVAVEKLDGIVARVSKLASEKESSELAALVVELKARKALLLSETGKAEEGRRVLASVREEAEKELAADADNEGKAMAFAAVLQVQTEFAQEGEEAEAARKAYSDLLVEQVKKHPTSSTILSAYVSAQTESIANLTRINAVQADQELKGVEEFLGSIESDDASILSIVRGSERTIAALKSRIESAKEQQALIGQSAIPLDAEAWANGEPLTDADLKGKVVLLDFWAVWCGPCIATFPHLREWNEKYAEKGLVIIGATRYYGYDWDDEAKRIKKVNGLSPEDEQKAMVRFAEHYQLKHRFMIAPSGSEFASKYAVRGIPQVVLIDRDGRIRMIRVGSGEANAHDLHAMIEELIAQPANNAAAVN